ncbi:MAG: head-tail connector protein, partial [Deltaproteobacteria bacterium]|nr:head-tail connector protein [Deltaproteobacteria bacterium]
MDMQALAVYCDALWNTRQKANAKLDEIARLVAPDRQGFSGPALNSEGREEIWDSTPEDAALTLASALHGMLTNPATDWLALRLLGDDDERLQAAEFVQTTTREILAVFSDPAGGFANEVGAFYLDLACLGTAVFYSGYTDGKGIRFKTVPLLQCAIAEGADGVVDTVLRRWTMTPGQLAEEFGAERLSDKAQSAQANKSLEQVEVAHLVIPHAKLPKNVTDGPAEMQGRQDAAKAVPFVSIHFETETKQLLRSGFFHESPYAVPRWSKRSGEVYGRGPGHACLPDMRVLNRVAFSQLVGAEKLADPPMVMTSDSVIGKLRTAAGGITAVDPTQCPGGDPARAVQQMPIVYNLEVAEAILEKRRAAIRSAFLNDRIQLAGGPQMTATEVIARERKQNLVLGPVLGRLENEFLGPLVDRVFLLLLRAGRITAPEELAGVELRASYISPVSRAQRQGEAEAFSRAMQYLTPCVQADPGILENFNLDRVARDSQELFGFPAAYLRTEQQVANARKQRAEQAQAMQE